MTASRILPYQIESELNEWPGTAKLVEEMGELGTNLGKLMSNGGQVHYWGGIKIGEEIQDELADVAAALAFFLAINGFDMARFDKRMNAKLERYLQWRTENRTETDTGTDNGQDQRRDPVGG